MTLDFSVPGKRIFISGHRGMVGRALVRRLENSGCEILTVDRKTIDLRDQRATFDWLMAAKPDAVIIAAAKVGGIVANSTRPAEFIYDNLAIECNVIEGARRAEVSKLLFLGSSCIYPKFAEQPIKEEALLTGALEPTNEWYAIAKIAGLKMAQAYRRQYGCNFISVMPTNLYGPWDNYHPTQSHVVPALIGRMHRSKQEKTARFDVWGTGTSRREFMHVDDLADACVFLLEHYAEDSHINVGTGSDVTINELVSILGEIIGWRGELNHLLDKPDGTPRKLLDIGKLTALGWRARIDLISGLRNTYEWYLTHHINTELSANLASTT